jgi:hypothetical protein
MKPLFTAKPPFENPPKVKEKIQWIEPNTEAPTEQIAGCPVDSEQDAIRAAEKFNEVAVSATLEGKTEFLFVTEVVEDKSGGWRVHIEQSNGGGWSPVVSDSN